MITAAPMSDCAKRASPALAMQLLFGAVTIDVMLVNRTELLNVGHLRVRAEPRARTSEDPVLLVRRELESASTACQPLSIPIPRAGQAFPKKRIWATK